MASSSPFSCLQCGESDSSFAHFKNGWRLRSGEFAQLCPRCSYAYNEGRFCEIFHSNDDGWRDCESCGKLVHCGCVVSFNAYMLLDFGGVVCMECSRMNFILARNRCLAFEKQLLLTGESQHRPRVSNLDSQLISKNSEPVLTPLFETLLSSTDLNSSHLLIPNKCAEALFPVISDPEGIPIKIKDTQGKEWEFKYCYWIISGNKIYGLQGLQQIMTYKRWQTGDTVVFYRVESGGMPVIGLRKASISRLPCNE